MKSRIKADMMTAWKSGDLSTKETLKWILGEIERNEDAVKKLNDSEIESLITKAVKNLRIVGGEGAEVEIETLSVYLPTLLEVDAIEEIVKVIIDQEGYSGIKDMGKVMGAFNKEFKGQADGKVLSEIVKEQLN